MMIIVLKMLEEERRCFTLRLVTIRSSSTCSYWTSIGRIITGSSTSLSDNNVRVHSLKTLIMSIFRSFREFGVVLFVYVAAMEQTMLFDSCLAYIINSVVVLIIADADELIFSGLSQKLSIESRLGKHKYKGLERNNTDDSIDNKHKFKGFGSEKNNTDDFNDNNGDEEDGSWRFDNSTVASEMNEAKTIHEYVDLYLTQIEKEAFELYDYYLVRLNFLSIILPLCHGKLTGSNCSENSFIRVSEIGNLYYYY